jgi:hypothetical protein
MNLVRKIFLLFTTFALTSTWLAAQVTNNRIEDRIPLKLDSGAFSSTTVQSDVQWDCINRALTSRCLVYHNDQWFTMTPPTAGPYYINIHGQQCKKAYGVQLVILEGDPCKTDSYQLKRCVPFSDQSDFYVKLDSLKPNMEYLVNVDGFLGDLCSFNIEFSSSLRGIPVNAANTRLLTPNTQLNDSIVSIAWTVNDSLAFTVKEFQLFRKREKDRSSVRVELPLEYNAYGAVQRYYEVRDTLSEKGNYVYSVYGSTGDDMLLLSRQSITFPKEKPRAIARRQRLMRREFVYFAPKAEFVTVHVLDNHTEQKLFTTNRRADKGKNVLLLDFTDMVENGVYFFKVIIDGKAVSEQFTVKIEPLE